MSFLVLQNISKTYKGGSEAVVDVSLTINAGETIALLGESGSGKSTLLRIIAGLEESDSGSVLLNGKVLDNQKVFVEPEKRNIGLVFQEYALFPHLNVYENVAIGIDKSLNKSAIVKENLGLTGLTEFEKALPQNLSGGQQQRVALARALAVNPALILLDEPFSNLDTSLKQKMRFEVSEIIKKSGKTAILVTHDTRDALELADKIAVIRAGRILQFDTPYNIYTKPFDLYTATLFAQINILSYQNEKPTTAIRPEFVKIESNQPYVGKVKQCLFTGVFYEIKIENTQYNLVVSYHNTPIKVGQEVNFGFNENEIINW